MIAIFTVVTAIAGFVKFRIITGGVFIGPPKEQRQRPSPAMAIEAEPGPGPSCSVA